MSILGVHTPPLSVIFTPEGLLPRLTSLLGEMPNALPPLALGSFESVNQDHGASRPTSPRATWARARWKVRLSAKH